MKIINRVLNVPLSLLKNIFNPDMICLLLIVIPQIVCVIALFRLRLSILWCPPLMLLTFILTYFTFGKLVEYDAKNGNKILEGIYGFFLKLYILNKNKYSNPINPEIYINDKIYEYNVKFQEFEQRMKNKQKKKESRIPTLFDLEFKEELNFFNLYNVDFDFNDIKREKRAMVKQHHPDQFNDEEEKQKHRILYEKTINYYNKIVNAKKF
jgi:hypothetical protein